MQRQRFLINGVHLHVAFYGKPAQQKQPLVLLHGFTGSSANWREISTQLETPARWLIVPDLPGHGQSDAPVDPERYTIEHCRADLLALLQTLDIQAGKAILLGYSMGGRIALYTALSGFFRALILESASPGLADPAEREQRRQQDNALAERIEREGVRDFVDAWERLPLFASQQRLPLEKQAALHEQRLANRAIGLANSLRGVGTGAQPALHACLSMLTLPTLIVAGELDGKFCRIARQMAEHIPHPELRIVADAGHTIHLEQPETFVSLARTFCDAL